MEIWERCYTGGVFCILDVPASSCDLVLQLSKSGFPITFKDQEIMGYVGSLTAPNLPAVNPPASCLSPLVPLSVVGAQGWPGCPHGSLLCPAHAAPSSSPAHLSPGVLGWAQGDEHTLSTHCLADPSVSLGTRCPAGTPGTRQRVFDTGQYSPVQADQEFLGKFLGKRLSVLSLSL